MSVVTIFFNFPVLLFLTFWSFSETFLPLEFLSQRSTDNLVCPNICHGQNQDWYDSLTPYKQGIEYVWNSIAFTSPTRLTICKDGVEFVLSKTGKRRKSNENTYHPATNDDQCGSFPIEVMFVAKWSCQEHKSVHRQCSKAVKRTCNQ